MLRTETDWTASYWKSPRYVHWKLGNIFLKPWIMNFNTCLLSPISMQFVPGIHMVIEYIIKRADNWRYIAVFSLLCKVDFFNRKRFGLFLCGALTETADHLVYVLYGVMFATLLSTGIRMNTIAYWLLPPMLFYHYMHWRML